MPGHLYYCRPRAQKNQKSNNSNYSAIQMRDICLQVSIQINITDVRCVFFACYTFLVHCMCSQWETRKKHFIKGSTKHQLKDKSWVVISATFTCQIIQTKKCVCVCVFQSVRPLPALTNQMKNIACMYTADSRVQLLSATHWTEQTQKDVHLWQESKNPAQTAALATVQDSLSL